MGKHTKPFKIHVSVTSKVKVKKTYSNVEHLMVLVKENCYYTIKDYVMVVTGALHHVKFQWQTILGFSQQRVNGGFWKK